MMTKSQSAVIGVAAAMAAMIVYFNHTEFQVSSDTLVVLPAGEIPVPTIEDCERAGESLFLCMQPPFNGRTFESESEVLAAIEDIKKGEYHPPGFINAEDEATKEAVLKEINPEEEEEEEVQ